MSCQILWIRDYQSLWFVSSSILIFLKMGKKKSESNLSFFYMTQINAPENYLLLEWKVKTFNNNLKKN